jgi:hypothetical protein
MAERQISEVEFLRRFRPDEYERRRQLGLYSSASPQPAAIPGLPPPESRDSIADALAYAESFQNPAGPVPGDRLSRVERLGPDATRVVYQSPSDRRALDQAATAAAVADQMVRNRVAELISPPQSRATGPMAEALAPAAQRYGAEAVVSELVGAPVAPELAQRAAQYADILQISPNQALELAQREALMTQRGRQGRLRAQTDTLPAELLQKAVAAGELGTDPAVTVLQMAERDGLFDPTTPIAAQQEALEPYLAAAQQVALERTTPYTTLADQERDDVNAQSGRGRKILGTGKRNAFDRVPGTAPPDPYLVPVLLAPVAETYTNRQGELIRQPRTFRPDPASPRKLYDARQVSMALLDPRAPLDPALGYLRTIDPQKEVSGLFGAGAGVPTAEALTGTVHGMGLREDTAARGESVPMTLGQAVQDIIYRHRTPLAEVPNADVVRGSDGQLFNRRTGQALFPARKESGGSDSATYRVGRNSEYQNEAFQEFGDLIEAVTGQRLVVNGRLQDPGLFRLQRAALGRALDDELLGVRGPTSGMWDGITGEPKPGIQRSLPIEGANPTFSVMRALAAGKSMVPAEGLASAVANAPSEVAFYRDLLGPQMEQLREGARQAAATQQLAAAQPRTASINTSAVSELNAPASPQPAPSPELLTQVPEAVRPNLEASFNAPAGSPRQRAAVDFLSRFMGRMRG